MCEGETHIPQSDLTITKFVKLLSCGLILSSQLLSSPHTSLNDGNVRFCLNHFKVLCSLLVAAPTLLISQSTMSRVVVCWWINVPTTC